VLESRISMALGTDSPLTVEGDLLDELEHAGGTLMSRLALVTAVPSRVFQLPPRPGDWIATSQFGLPPKLVVIEGRIRLIDPALAEWLPPNLRGEFHRLNIQTRPPVLVRWNIPELLEQTRRHLGPGPIRLGGREVGG
jgi:hypothetical protein